MKVAIMQPYFFPYIGYFQLINAVDCFIFYDDVNFIKGGWIHRNQILINGKPKYFTVPLIKQSSFLQINDTQINTELYHDWRIKFLKSLILNYSKAPYYDGTFELITRILNGKYKTISDLSITSIKMISEELELSTKVKRSSVDFSKTKNLKGVDRLIEICKTINAEAYINPIGGQKLYKNEQFLKENVKLFFLKSNDIYYNQLDNEYVPWLSIIDIMMFNSNEEIKSFLNNFSFI